MYRTNYTILYSINYLHYAWKRWGTLKVNNIKYIIIRLSPIKSLYRAMSVFSFGSIGKFLATATTHEMNK